MDLEEFTGLSLEEAKIQAEKIGISRVRVISKTGTYTRDYRKDRINLELNDNDLMIIRAWIG